MKALSRWATVGGAPFNESLGMSHLPGSPGSEGELKEDERERVDVARRLPGCRCRCLRRTSCWRHWQCHWRRAIIGEADRNVEEGVTEFRVGDMQVLIADEAEELVLDDGPAESASGNVAVQVWYLFASRNVGILIEEERCGVDPVGAAVKVGGARARCLCRRRC
jgi:hypothetical protein